MQGDEVKQNATLENVQDVSWILHSQTPKRLSSFPFPFRFLPAKGIRTSYACTLQFENFFQYFSQGLCLNQDPHLNWYTGSWKPLLSSKFSSSLPSYPSQKVAVAQELSREEKKRREKKVFWERSHMVWKRPHSEILIDFYKRTHPLLQHSRESLLYMGKIRVAQLECLNVHFKYIFSFHPNIPTR